MRIWTRRELLTAAGGFGLAATRRSEAFQSAAENALARAEAAREELIELLSALVATPSPVGTPAEAAQDQVARYLIDQDYGVEVTSDDPMAYASDPEFMPPGEGLAGVAVNVTAKPRSRGAAPRLALFAHIDTERGDGPWETDKMTPVIRDNRMYGLGTADDKGGVAAMLVAASILARTGGAAPTVMSLHGKGGGSRGSLPAFRHESDFDAVLYLHPAETGRGLADVKHVVQGALDLVLTVGGWRGEPLEIGSPDSSLYSEGGDALQACLLAIDGLRESVLRGFEVNVGRLDAGDRIGSVPARCQAEIRVLFHGDTTTGELLDAIGAQLNSLSDALATRRGRFHFELGLGRLKTNPATVSWDARSCRKLRSAITAVTGAAPEAHTRHYAGDIRYPIRLAGAPAFGVGSLGGNFYGPNEWVDLDDLVNLVAVTLLTMESWAQGT